MVFPYTLFNKKMKSNNDINNKSVKKCPQSVHIYVAESYIIKRPNIFL